MGEVSAVLTARPRPSKYPGKPEYCDLTIGGESWQYNTETPAIADQLRDVPLNVPLRITAAGSKEAAHLEVELSEGDLKKYAPAHKSTEAPTTHARTAAQNRVQAPAQAPAAPTCSRGYWDALDVAVALVEQFKARHGREPSEAERAIAATLYIEFNRSGKPLSRGAQ
jgi:hypothetical protein